MGMARDMFTWCLLLELRLRVPEPRTGCLLGLRNETCEVWPWAWRSLPYAVWTVQGNESSLCAFSELGMYTHICHCKVAVALKSRERILKISSKDPLVLMVFVQQNFTHWSICHSITTTEPTKKIGILLKLNCGLGVKTAIQAYGVSRLRTRDVFARGWSVRNAEPHQDRPAWPTARRKGVVTLVIGTVSDHYVDYTQNLWNTSETTFIHKLTTFSWQNPQNATFSRPHSSYKYAGWRGAL